MWLSIRALVLSMVLALTLVPASSGSPKQPSHEIAGSLEVSTEAGLGRLELHGDIGAALQRDEGVVALLDLSRPERPKVLGRYDDGASQSLDGDLAFSTNGEWLFYARQTVQFSKDGLHVLDVSDPSAPTLASYQPGGGSLRVAHYDDGTTEWVVLMDATSGMVVYRFEPTTGVLIPVHVNPLPATKVGGPASAGVVIQKDPILKKPLLYASTGMTGVEVFDFSDPTNPKLLGSWDEMGLAEIEVRVTGKHRMIYGAAEYWFDKAKPPVVEELDASHLDHIKLERELSVGCKTDDTQRVQGMALAGDALYVANSTIGLPVYFGANYFRFTPVTRGAQNAGAGFQGIPYVFDVEVQGRYVYATDAATGYLTVLERHDVRGWRYNRDELEWNNSERFESFGC
ncbi:MAG: hypothetical protein QOG04_450 [Actinomycetota bacterium]|jgi:hypothetical protein|nr:hypothetical protein [Actinomycetota bacterium]